MVDLSLSNNLMLFMKFEIRTIASANFSIRKDGWMTSINLKDAFLVDVVYQFRLLCFSLFMAPRVFTSLQRKLHGQEYWATSVLGCLTCADHIKGGRQQTYLFAGHLEGIKPYLYSMCQVFRDHQYCPGEGLSCKDRKDVFMMHSNLLLNSPWQ